MTARTTAGPLAGRRGLYLLLVVLAAIPIALFAGGPLQGDDFSLKGPGGPLLAFSAGVLSFVSPCVLPLVPVYVAHLSGASIERGRVVADRRRTLTHALVFVAGFSAVFIFLGASVGLLGSYVVRDHEQEIQRFAGAALMLLGIVVVPAYGRRSPLRSVLVLLALTGAYFLIADLARIENNGARLLLLAGVLGVAWLRFAGYLELPILQRTFQVDVARGRQTGYLKSLLVGSGFAAGWVPCIGPILGSILTLASSSGEAMTGFYLLVAYSAGLGLPFILTGLALSDATKVLRRLQPYAPYIEAGTAVMIIGLGALLWTDRLTSLNEYFGFADFNEGL